MAVHHLQTFGALLRRFRLRGDLSQEELAELAQVSWRTVSDLERGVTRKPYRETVRRLAHALALSDQERRQFVTAAGVARSGYAREEPQGSPYPPTNLPFEVTSFVGRELELQTISELLQRPGVRLLTLLGAGGTGKTRLAVRAGRSLLPSFDDGVYLVSLAPLRDPAHLIPAIGSAVGIKEVVGQSWLETLAHDLRSRRLLLILDNVEHLLDAGSRIRSLLEQTEHVRILATSRAPLRVYGENELFIAPLPVPDPARLPTPAELGRIPSVALFCDRARAIQADFVLTRENGATLAEICLRLDGLPLAIELAAARLRLFSAAALLRRLSSRLQLLKGGTGDLPERQQTISATIDWSHSLLSGEEQALFARLAVFTGGCTLEAAEGVCTPAGDVDVLEGMVSLVGKSLLQRRGEDGARFTMLEMVAEYAGAKLRERDEEEAVRSAHARYFLCLAEEAEPELQTVGQAARLASLNDERDNLRAALQWFLDHGSSEEGARLATALYRYWYALGYWSEGRRWLERALADAGELGPVARARAFLALGELAGYQGASNEAIDLQAQALELFRMLGDRRGSARALVLLGQAALLQGQQERASTVTEEGLSLYRELGDPRGAAAAVHTLANLAVDRGDLAEARVRFEEARDLFEAAGDAAYVAETVLGLGWIALREERLAEAEALFDDSLKRARGLGVKHTMGYALLNQAEIARREGQLEPARERLRAAWPLAMEVRDEPLILALLQGGAALLLAECQAERAVRLLGTWTVRRERLESPLSPSDEAALKERLGTARECLGDELVSRAWEYGRRMGLEEAIETVGSRPD